MTTSVLSEEKPNPVRVVLAWGVHLIYCHWRDLGIFSHACDL